MYVVISYRRFVWFVVLATVITTSVSTAGYAFVTSYVKTDSILSGVRIASINVGGLTRQEAMTYLAGLVEDLMHRPVTVTYGTRSWELIPADVGITVDEGVTIDRALQVGRQGNFFRRLADRYLVYARGWQVPLSAKVDRARLTAALRKIAVTLNIPPIDARFVITPDDEVQIIPGSPGQKVDLATLIDQFVQASLRFSRRTVTLQPEIITPRITTENARSMGIRRLVAEYVTRFNPNDTNRVHNIRLAAETLAGELIAPGETFSFNQVVGPRLAEEGYKPAPVIIDGEFLPGIGGGVCQVSTTLYNTVLLAGLDVIERVPHSLPIHYVPLGRDAAVAYDYIDLVFQNTTPYWVLLDTKVGKDELAVRIFSDAPAERTVSLESEIVNVLEPRIVYRKDLTLPPGVVIEEHKGRRGYKVYLWRIIKVAGQTLTRELVAKTIYHPRDAVIRQGAGPAF